MPIPEQRIPLSLTAATPSEVTVEKLKQQLDAIGLTCAAADPERLQEYIIEVKNQLPNGSVQSYGIFRPASPDEVSVDGSVTHLVESSIGNWVPDNEYGYKTQLEYIQYKTHFDWLKANRPSFTGIENNPPQYSGKSSSVSAIKNQFIQVAYTASSTLIKGLNKQSMESVLSNAIASLSDKNATNYDPGPQSRVLVLVENYDPEKNLADAIGVLTIDWTLKIQDYKKKKEMPEHQWTLDVSARAVTYSSVAALNADYMAALAHFKDEHRYVAGSIPPENTKVEVFTSLPPAVHQTFIHSLPVVSTENYIDVIVLYAPDLQNIGSIDNTSSQASSTWQKSVTSGFTFTTSQTLSVTAKFEVSVKLVKFDLEIGLNISFTEQWSKSTTETISFTVPPGSKAFTYQGYMMSAILRYDAASNTYTYKDTAQFLTSVIATSDKPLLQPA